MKQRTEAFIDMISRLMLLIAGVGIVAVLAMRIWLMPAVRDWETGLFSNNYWVIGMMLFCLVALLVMGYLCGPNRRDITGRPSLLMGVALLVAGLALAVGELLNLMSVIPELRNWITMMKVGAAQADTFGSLPLQVLQGVVGIAGGGALIMLGMRLFSEGGVRRGIAQWSALLPVLWMWLRLINYEMSYSSMVRLEDSFFGFMMMLLEMWFLFRLARYVSGVGRVSMGSLLGCSLVTALFSLTAPVVRLCMYLLQDFASYEESLATVSDFAVGLLAAIVAIALYFSDEGVQSSGPSEVDAAAAEEFASSDAYLVAELITSVPEEENESNNAE